MKFCSIRIARNASSSFRLQAPHMLAAQEGIERQLLRERAASLADVAVRQIPHHRAGDSHGIDPVMAEKSRILPGQQRLDEIIRHRVRDAPSRGSRPPAARRTCHPYRTPPSARGYCPPASGRRSKPKPRRRCDTTAAAISNRMASPPRPRAKYEIGPVPFFLPGFPGVSCSAPAQSSIAAGKSPIPIFGRSINLR